MFWLIFFFFNISSKSQKNVLPCHQSCVSPQLITIAERGNQVRSAEEGQMDFVSCSLTFFLNRQNFKQTI